MIGIKELKYNWKKYILVEIIVVLMMFMVLFLSGLVGGLGRAMGSGIDNMDVTKFMLSDKAEKLIQVSSIDSELYGKIKEKYADKVTSVNIQRSYIQRDKADEKIGITFIGIEPDGFLIPKVYDGEKDLSEKDTIILDEQFSLEGIKVGDIVRNVNSKKNLKVVGFVKDSTYSHVPIGYVSRATYLSLMRESNPLYKESIRAIATKDNNIEAFKDLQTLSKREVIEAIPGYKAQQLTIKMIQWLLVIITGVVIGIFFFVVNMQKEKEFGVLKAIGINMFVLMKTILLQVSIIAVSGALISTVLVFALGSVLPMQVPFYIIIEQIILVLLVFVLISIICSLATIKRVAKIDPATIIGGDFQ